MKSGGNLSMFRLTACMRALGSTPYNSARSKLSITLRPLSKKMRFSMRSIGITSVMVHLPSLPKQTLCQVWIPLMGFDQNEVTDLIRQPTDLKQKELDTY